MTKKNSPTNTLDTAGKSNETGKNSTCLVACNNKDWIIDRGAINHMVSNVDMLDKESVTASVQPKKVYLPNGDVSLVTHTDQSSISNRSTLKDVFLLPQFKYNLMYVSKRTTLWCFLLS